jgi:hypothetical protein
MSSSSVPTRAACEHGKEHALARDGLRTFLSELGALEFGYQPIHCITIAIGRIQNFLYNSVSNRYA